MGLAAVNFVKYQVLSHGLHVSFLFFFLFALVKRDQLRYTIMNGDIKARQHLPFGIATLCFFVIESFRGKIIFQCYV